MFQENDAPGDADYVTGPDVLEHMRVGYMRGSIEFLCVASRAFEPVFLENKDRLPSEPFFRPLDRYAAGALDDGDLHRGIREFLRSNNISCGFQEDFTLALCRYNSSYRLALGLL